MQGSQQHFDDFVGHASPNLVRRCAAEIACIYIRAPDGVCVNVSCRVLLVPESWAMDGHVGTPVVDIDGLRALRGRISPVHVEPMLRGLAAGEIPLEQLPAGSPDAIRFMTGGRDLKPYNFMSPTFHERASMSAEFALNLPADTLSGAGSSVGEILTDEMVREIGRRLPAQNPPFAGLSGLAKDLGIPDRIETRQNACVEVISPYWLQLAPVEQDLGHSTVEVQVWSAWDNVGVETTVSLVPSTSGRGEKKHISTLADDGWKRIVAENTVTLHRSLPAADLGLAQVFLNYGGRRIERQYTGMGNARLVAHEMIDSGFQGLRDRCLGRDGRPPKSDQFEEGVAWLLHLCGFSAERVGAKDLQRAPDVVAFNDSDCAVFAECTVEAPAPEKIRKVASRAEQFRARMESAHGKTMRIVRAVFLPLRRGDLDPDAVENAYQSDHVVLVCAEDLMQLLDNAKRGQRSSDAFEYMGMLGNPFGPIYY